MAGVLGGEVLGRCPFTLDYQAETLTFHHPDTFRPPAGAACNDLVIYYDTPICPTTIAGRREMIMLDTGSRALLSLSTFLARRNLELVRRAGRTCYVSLTAGGLVEEAVVPLEDFVIFGRTVPEAKASFNDNSSIYNSKRNGLVGTSVLTRWRLTLDYRRGKVWAEPAREGAGDDPANPNARDFLDGTPLMRRCSLERARRLIDAGADVNAANKGGSFVPLWRGPGGARACCGEADIGRGARQRAGQRVSRVCGTACGGRQGPNTCHRSPARRRCEH